MSVNVPHGYELEDAHIFGCYGQHMERTSQVWCKGDVMYGVCDCHQSLHLGILPKTVNGMSANWHVNNWHVTLTVIGTQCHVYNPKNKNCSTHLVFSTYS